MKTCSKCGERKPLNHFYRQEGMRDGYRNNCKSCHAASHRNWYLKNRDKEIQRVRQWQQANPEKVNSCHRKRRQADPRGTKLKNREGHLRRKYGLTQNMFEALVLAQLGHCAICGVSEGMDLHVDHDHQTKKVRGLLCGKCNKAIGLLNDDPELLTSARSYLQSANRFWGTRADGATTS